MEDQNPECSECGKEFDSERGLHIHQSQVHQDEQERGEEKMNSESIEFGVRTAMFGVFFLGIFVGLSSGLVFAELNESSSISQEQIQALQPDQENSDSAGSDQISGSSTIGALKDIAESVGADGDKIEQCINNADEEEINQDKNAIRQAAGSFGTPTFFIGNSEIGYTQLEGAQPYSRMQSTIENKISEAENGGSVGDNEFELGSISIQDEPTLGDSDALINIIEYSDYGCPWCAEWHGADAIPQRPIDEEDSFNEVRNNHVQNGEVRFVMKDFPVSQLHPDAITAHKAANCVLENSPDSYWDFNKKLYEERDKWQN